MTVTANDEPTEIEADVDKRFSSMVVNLPVQQTGTGTPSPSNPRPFTKWTDVSLYVSDTEEADEPTLSIELPTPMYGGKVDMVRGEIATTYNSKESGTGWEMTEEGQFRCQVSAYNNGDETSTNVADLYAVHYETVSNKDAYDATDDLTCGLATIDGTTYLYVNDAQYTTLESFATHIAEEVFVFRAHIPMSDVTEPHIVYLPEGTSYVWADAGFVEVTVDGTPPLSLTNSLGKPLKAWSVDLLPYQEGTGDPSPDNVRPIHGTDKLTITTAGRNMLPNTATTRTINGVTFTVNADGSVTANGTATADAQLVVGSYTSTGALVVASGCPANGSNTTYRMFATYIGADYGNGISSTALQFPSGRVSDVRIYVYSGYTAENLTFYPMIKFVGIPAGYVPYVAPSQTVLTLPQTVYTGTIGSEGGESNGHVLDLGNSVWTTHSSGNFYTEGFIQDWVANRTFLCSQYKFAGVVYGVALLTDDMSFAIQPTANSTQTRLIIRDTTKSALTATEFKSAMSGVQMFYDNATPTIFPLTVPTIPTPTGTATAWATAEDGNVDSMSVTYIAKPN